MITTRFAPSPTGLLHLGHAYAALFAAWWANNQEQGQFLLRLEDIDQTRCKTTFIDQMLEDLAWLGLAWPEPVWQQSQRGAVYQAALDQLEAQGLLYPCFCTRKQIAAEIATLGHAPHGPEGPLYPGTCKRLSHDECQGRQAAGEAYSLRLDSHKAVEKAGFLPWQELWYTQQSAPQNPTALGDVILARKDFGVAYHLVVVVDDAAQGITHVTRGCDLIHATPLHRLLQALLDLPAPQWAHHRLILNAEGKRFAKRDQGVTLQALQQEGWTAQKVRHWLYQQTEEAFLREG